jgi:hypothetical protein
MSETLLQAQDPLEPVLGRRSTMHTLNRRRCLGIAAAGAFVALTAVGLPARAEELVQHLGPVGAHEPILTTFGNKRVIAFYDQTTVIALSTPWSMRKRTLTPA